MGAFVFVALRSARDVLQLPQHDHHSHSILTYTTNMLSIRYAGVKEPGRPQLEEHSLACMETIELARHSNEVC